VSLRLDVGVTVVPGAPGGTDVIFGAALSVSSSFGSARVTDETAERRTVPVDGLEVIDRLYPKSKPEGRAP